MSLLTICTLVILLISPAYVYSEPWWRVETDTFVIYTDVEQSDALQLAQYVGNLAELAPQYLLNGHQQHSTDASVAQDLELLIFARRRDFSKLLDPRHFVAFTQPGLTSTLLMVAPSTNWQSLLANLRHEYAHYYMRKQKLYYPPWYDEGMAGLFEYVSINEQGQAQLDSDALFNRYTEPLRGNYRLSFRQLLSTTTFTHWSRERLQRFYGLSGQLVHYLAYGHQNGYPDRRNGMHQYLESGATDLAESLGVSIRQLQRDFRRYRRSNSKPQHKTTLNGGYTPPKVRKMQAYEVLSVQAQAAEGANPRAALARYKQAVELMPTDAQRWIDLSRIHMRMGETTAAQQALATAQSLAPDTTNVMIAQAKFLMRDCWQPGVKDCVANWQQASDMIHAALDQDPENLDGVYLLGLVDLYRGRADLAANYLWITHRYAPWVPKVNYHLGECLRLLGDSRAQIYLRNARDWSHEEIWRKGAQASLAMLK